MAGQPSSCGSVGEPNFCSNQRAIAGWNWNRCTTLQDKLFPDELKSSLVFRLQAVGDRLKPEHRLQLFGNLIV